MSGDPDRWFLRLPKLGIRVAVEPANGGAIWRIYKIGDVHALELGNAPGVRAAATAATNHLCANAKLTLQLAARKP
jgi:hypothetical protein